MTQCSVCGKKVNTNKNMVSEHTDKRGITCYGSFMPLQTFNPFTVRNTIVAHAAPAPVWAEIQPMPAVQQAYQQ